VFRKGEAMRTILVPVDLSDVTRCVVSTAGTLTGDLGAKAILLHVVEPPKGEGTSLPSGALADAGLPTYIPPPESWASMLEHERETLEDLAEAIRAKGAPAAVLLRHGPPAPAILEAAEEVDAGMIILGSHGRSGILHRLLGGVSEAVLQDARCPVLVVPSEKREEDE
jgi:universal stress protein A